MNLSYSSPSEQKWVTYADLRDDMSSFLWSVTSKHDWNRMERSVTD